MKIVYLFFLTLILSCDVGEIPTDPRPSGLLTTTSVEMMENYQMQVYFDLYKNEIISNTVKTDWDICFESGYSGWRININSSKFMQVWEVNNENFNSNLNISNAIWKWDHQSGNPDSNAIGDYRNKEVFYVIDMGYSVDDDPIGYIKLSIDSVNNDSYTIRLSSLENDNDTTIDIEKSAEYEKIYFSFEEYSIKEIEPSYWDLLFTTYTHLFSPDFPYLVSGVLTNTSHVKVAKDTIHNFEDINFDVVENLNFSSDQNIIGYNWKSYDLNSGVYSINTSINYLIKTHSDKYFKLRFIDFYDTNGIKGYPKFEFQEL